MGSKRPYVDPSTMELLCEKASRSPCTYKVSGIAFDKKGNILGHATNSHSKNWNVLDKYDEGRAGTGMHVERRLLARYKDLVSSILICRVGHSGEIRPIDPCPTCQKVARKYGVKIISVLPGSL